MLEPLKEHVRRRLPRRRCVFNGSTVRTYRWRGGRVRPDFEAAIADRLRDGVREGDRVVVVGGGHGVCSTVAARQGALVTVYEPGGLWTRTIRETAELNRVSDSVEVVHGAVGPIHDAWSSSKGAERLEPGDIPECDWLVLDCEGAELDILKGLQTRPPRLSVETHPPRVLTEEAGVQVEALGYEVVERVDGDGADVLHARRADR